jgi:hypothetical protein
MTTTTHGTTSTSNGTTPDTNPNPTSTNPMPTTNTTTTNETTTSTSNGTAEAGASSNFGALAKAAIADLKGLATELPLDDAITKQAFAQLRVNNRVPLGVLSIAAQILNEAPALFPQFDAVEAQAALDYVTAMGPVATAASALATRLRRSVFKRRANAANQALALYAVLKGTARLPANVPMLDQVKEMGQLLTTHRKSRKTSVTKKETGQMVKVARTRKQAEVAQAEADQATAKAAAAHAVAAAQAEANEGSPSAAPPAASPAPSTPPTPAAPTTPTH